MKWTPTNYAIMKGMITNEPQKAGRWDEREKESWSCESTERDMWERQRREKIS